MASPQQDDILDSALNSVLNPNLDALYEAAGRKYNINPLWLKAQDQHEVGNLAAGDGAAGDADHVGHGQIGPAWRTTIGLDNRPVAADAIDGMAKIMRQLINKHGGDIGSAQLEYTGGKDMKQWGKNTLAYPGEVAKNYNALGGKPGQIAYPGGQADVLGDALKDIPTVKPPGEPAPSAAPARSSFYSDSASPWSGLANTADSWLLGQGNKIGAALAAIGRPGTFSANYNAIKNTLDQSKTKWAGENPGTSIATDLAGSLPPTALALATGQDYAVAPVARALSTIGPKTAGVVNYLTGEATGGALARGVSRILPGATAGGATGVLQSGMNPQSSSEQGKVGAAVGALFGPLGGAVGDVLASNVAPRIASMANRLMAAGVPLSPGQIPGVSPVLNFLHAKFGDAGGVAARAGLTKALTKTFGEDAPEITPQVIAGAQKRIGGIYDRFGGATVLKDQTLKENILDALAEAHGDLGEGSGIPDDKLKLLRDTAGLISNTGSAAEMSGKNFLALTKRGSQLDRLMLDPDVGHHAGMLRDALTGALERSVSAANGRWVPAGAAVAAQGSRDTMDLGMSSAGLLDRQAPNKLLEAPVGHVSVEPTAPGPPPAPGMVWQIDPQTQTALTDLRNANGQYKNLKLVSGIADPATGEVNPTALARRVSKFYPPSAQRPPGVWEQRMQDLAPAKLFIPPGGTAAKQPNKLLQTIQHYGLIGGAAVGGEQLLEHFANDPTTLAAGLGIGALGYGASKGATKLLDSPMNARRILAAALSRQPQASSLANALLTPTAVHLYNRKDATQ